MFDFSEGSSSNVPSMPVMVPFMVPLKSTVAPGSGSLVLLSVTLPFTGFLSSFTVLGAMMICCSFTMMLTFLVSNTFSRMSEMVVLVY